MFIINPEILEKAITVNEDIAKIIINEYKIPLLSKVDDVYYFADTYEVKSALKKITKESEGGEIVG